MLTERWSEAQVPHCRGGADRHPWWPGDPRLLDRYLVAVKAGAILDAGAAPVHHIEEVNAIGAMIGSWEMLEVFGGLQGTPGISCDRL